MNQGFGSLAPRDLPLVPVPVGEPCLLCGETIGADDSGVIQPFVDGTGQPTMRPAHRECLLRSVVGSVGHQLGFCSCNGGPGTLDDPPDMTKRQAALAAVELFEQQQQQAEKTSGRPLLQKYDRAGKPISLGVWARYMEDHEYKVVVQETLPNGRWVSTVWLGIDHRFAGSGPPLVFETMVFSRIGDSESLDCRRSASEPEARMIHEQMCRKWKVRPNRRVKRRVLKKWANARRTN